MGSCCDSRAGTLLWVRRPNGSWWPGLVISPDELPERRKGTPVKLLGREDGSMDWYDLQKSKRIKAFRCGEYDDCIEKAKASAVGSYRGDRKGKYAKRRHAILHALEIEKAYHATDINKFPCKEQNYMDKKFIKRSKEMKVLSQSVVLVEQDPSTPNLKVKKQKYRNQGDSRDATTAGMKRMRGLHDLGPGLKSKREFDTIEATKLQEKSSNNDGSVTETNICNGFLHQRKGNSSSFKRRPRIAQLNGIFKRKDRRRPLTKVLESTAKVDVVDVHSSSNQKSSSCKLSVLGMPQNKSCTLDSSESRKTDLSAMLNDRSDCSDDTQEEASDEHEDTCHAIIDKTYLNPEIKGTEPLTLAGVGDASCYGLFDVHAFIEKTCSEDVSYPATTNSCCAVAEEQFNHHGNAGENPNKKDIRVPCPANQYVTEGTSKRRSKGRRNSKCQRTLAECYMMDGSHGDGSSTGSGYNTLYESFTSENDGQVVRSAREVENVKVNQIPEVYILPYGSEERDFGSKQLATHFSYLDDPLRNETSREEQIETNFASTISVFSFPSQKATSQRQTQLSMNYQGLKSNGKTSAYSFLYDVTITMQSSCKPSHVPLVSLVSKLNGSAVIGHPITVEATESCFSDLPVNGANSCSFRHKAKTCREKTSHKRKAGVQSIRNGYHCRTSNLHQRKKHPSGRSLKAQKGSCSNFRNKSIRSKKNSSRIMKSELLSQKIRTLSSIAEYTKKKVPVMDKLKGSVVACVPLKIVFSRINEALGRNHEQQLDVKYQYPNIAASE